VASGLRRPDAGRVLVGGADVTRLGPHRPRLLLLDEPSSGLDGAETEAFGGLVRELAAEGRGVLLVEHDMDLVNAVCDRVHVLDAGAVLVTGTPAEVRADERVREVYLGAAAGG
jgi:branched-chain amino acid transport system ATP-binding protein